MATKMTREEAIKILMGYSHTPQERAALEVLIPELAESEDERIRKEIIEFIRSQIEDGNSVGWDRWIAYLEKQKEQKPVDYDAELKKCKDNPLYFFDKYVSIKQKPVDNPKWNELTWKDINELERIINNVHYEFQNGIGEDSFGELVLEKFREYKDDSSMDEQKPTDLSDLI